jgi:hypothetical protein
MSEEKKGNKKKFTVEVDGAPVALAVVSPTPRDQLAATNVYNRAFREAVTPSDGGAGALVRAKLESVLRAQNLWDDAKQTRYEELRRTILSGERRLEEGGIKLSAARVVALDMGRARLELRRLTVDRNRLDEVTAEAQAEQARFNFYVAACTVYDPSGKKYYKDTDDFLTREGDVVAAAAPAQLAKLLYGLEDDYEQKLPENKFLLKYKFVDEKLRLIDKQGKFVDEEGRPVDEFGRLVNGAGELVDAEGNLLTEDGDYKVEFKGFEDDVFDQTPTAV